MLSSIFGTFTQIANWIVTSIRGLEGLFIDRTGEAVQLTFLGTLSVCGLGISVIFLLIGVIQNFLHFRG